MEQILQIKIQNESIVDHIHWFSKASESYFGWLEQVVTKNNIYNEWNYITLTLLFNIIVYGIQIVYIAVQ
jgi:hypothetical protein